MTEKTTYRELQELQRFSSEVFWHFVGRDKEDEKSFDILINILKSGLKVGARHEKQKYLDIKNEKTAFKDIIGFPVNCVADIPLKDLPIHAERYGQFAIGFLKSSVVKAGFNPVWYVIQPSLTLNRIVQKGLILEEKIKSLNRDDLLRDYYEFVTYLTSSAKLMSNGPLRKSVLADILALTITTLKENGVAFSIGNSPHKTWLPY